MEHLCLHWNNHQSTLLNVFDRLLSSESFIDVSLCAEGRIIGAHKLVLSACSPYFEALFKQCGDRHPVIFLKDVKYDVLQYLLDYMYRGEINVSHEELPILIKTAESLQIKGLVDDESKHTRPSKRSIPPNISSNKEFHTGFQYEGAKKLKPEAKLDSLSCAQFQSSQTRNPNLLQPNDIQDSNNSTEDVIAQEDPTLSALVKEEQMDVKSEEDLNSECSTQLYDPSLDPEGTNVTWDTYPDQNLEGSQYSSMGDNSGSAGNDNSMEFRFGCEKCGRSYKRRRDWHRHIKFECGVERQFQCSLCAKKFKRRDHLKLHVNTVHNCPTEVLAI